MTLEQIEQRITCVSAMVNTGLFRLAALATAFMVLPTVADVLYRFLFEQSIVGAMDMVELCMVVLVFGGLGFVQQSSGHIRVNLLLEKMPQPMSHCMEFFSSLCPFLLLTFMGVCLFNFALTKLGTGETSHSLEFPLYISIFFASVGTFAFALALLGSTLRSLNVLLQQREYVALLIGVLLCLLMVSLGFLLKDTTLVDTPALLGGGGMGLLILLILLGMPIGMAMALVGVSGMVIFYPQFSTTISMLGMGPYNTASSYVYAVVPMFILMGELAMQCGISRDLFNSANIWLGRLPGGLAIASISGCAGFAAVSGDSMATAVTMGSVALPEMRKKKYDPGLACATLAAGGTLGILIPPSTGFIFYSLVTEVSIGKLFVAGIMPGLLLTVLFVLVLLFFAKRRLTWRLAANRVRSAKRWWL